MIPKIKIFEPKFGNPEFSLCSILVLVGSIYEKEHEKGISHYIEHLLFQGSSYAQNMQTFTNSLNSKGMIINASTSQYLTRFYIESLTSDIEMAIENLVQMVFNPLFRDSDVKEEKQVVLNELMERLNSPEQFSMEESLKLIYPNKNPLHFSPGGPIDIVKKIDKEEILNYYHKYYQPKNIIFVSITKKDKEITKKLWEKAFEKYSNYTNNVNNSIPSTMEIYRSMQPELRLINPSENLNLHKMFPKNDTYFVTMIYLNKRPSNKNITALSIFQNYLAGSLSSILFIELREKRQLIYSVHSTISLDLNNVDIEISFNCKKDKKVLDECFKVVNDVIKDCIKNGIPVEEFKKFKNKTIVNVERMKSSRSYELNEYISKLLFNIETDSKMIKKINNSFLHKSVDDFFNDCKKYSIIT